MNKRDLAIGVFDSGVGGLSVVREIVAQLPHEDVVYFADSARLPYGSKSRDTIIHYSRQIVSFLKTKGVKAIVIACNTATTYALESLLEEEDIAIMGVIEAGAHNACLHTCNCRVGVIGTEGTIASNIYAKTIKQMNPDIEVFQKACPLLVPLVEEGLVHDSVTDEIIARYVADLKAGYVDTLVLACTHYPLLLPAVRRIMGDKVALIDPAYETVHRLKTMLYEKDIYNTKQVSAKYDFYVSDYADKFKDFASYILEYKVSKVYEVDIEAY